jgi:outer membrane immunogenic protein
VTPAFITKAPTVEPVAAWSGPYIGLGIGARSTLSTASLAGGTTTTIFGVAPIIVCATCVSSEPLDDTAFRIAPYLGWNWQIGPRWLVGIEGDWGWADRTTSLTGMDYPESGFMSGNAADSFSLHTTWDASARARVGVLVTPTVLAYVTGGAAWQSVQTTSNCATSFEACAPFIFIGGGTGFLTPGVISHSVNQIGPTVGFGLEAKLWQNFLARAEYRYANFGTISNSDFRSCAACIAGPASEIVSYNVRLQTHTAMFGMAYQFSNLLGL